MKQLKFCVKVYGKTYHYSASFFLLEAMALLFVIEHLEAECGKWLYFEYENASRIVGRERLIFTSVKRAEDAEILSNLGVVRRESFIDLFDQKKIIILDPRAKERLKPEDLISKEAVIIGGILGDHPPRGRTRRLITLRAPEAAAKSIGRGQFSIDGAVYVTNLVSEGFRLEDIPVRRGLRVKVNDVIEVYLPYMYPLKDGKPVVSEKLLRYIASVEIVRDEEELLRGINREEE
ncbi:MAG: SAM-dependent methyltransferase [Candidatus Bathyarchaeia archaeon]